jgi:hypothetical protein
MQGGTYASIERQKEIPFVIIVLAVAKCPAQPPFYGIVLELAPEQEG